MASALRPIALAAMPTTAPLGPSLMDRLASIPPVGWLVIAALLAVFVRWVQIRLATAGGPDEYAARNTMTDIFVSMRRAAAGAINTIADARTAAASANMVLRDVDPTAIDPRRIILHDDRPVRPIAAFPRMIRGRLVLLGTGRIVLVSESAFEKLLEADEALAGRKTSDLEEDNHGEKRD